MAFVLQVDSSNQIFLNPDYAFDAGAKKIQSNHRTRGGSLYQYKWSEYDVFKIPISFVTSSTRAIVNSWWSSNADLVFFDEDDTSETFAVRVVGNKKPISKFMKPYKTEHFKGVISLEVF